MNSNQTALTLELVGSFEQSLYKDTNVNYCTLMLKSYCGY